MNALPLTDEQAKQIDVFAALVLMQQQAEMRRQYGDEPGQWRWERVNVKVRKLYTLVDVGPEHNMSGKYMVEHATGCIFGILAYGKVDKRTRYGTLDTIHEWQWGGYRGRREQ